MTYPRLLMLMQLIFAGYMLQAQDVSPTKNKVTFVKKRSKSAKYKLAQFDGRWQETIRTSTKTKKAVDFTDTIYLRFYDLINADTKEGNSVVITGTAEISRNDDITTSARDFKIISVAQNEIVLDDEKGFVHSFVRKEIFAYEIKVAPPVAMEDTTKPVVDISPVAMSKNWFAYRRGANPGFIKPETPMIRGINIKEKTGEGIYKAEIEYSTHGQAVTKPCSMVIDEAHNLTISTEGVTWNVILYKSDGQELIFGKKGELVYYFRPL